MESAVVFRSFNCVASPLRPTSEKPGVFPVNVASFSGFSKHTFQGLAYGGKLIACPSKMGGVIVSCAKASEANLAAKSAGDSNGAVKPDINQKVSDENQDFQELMDLLHYLSNNPEIDEVTVKAVDFEMHIKRDIESPKAPIGSPTVALPIPSIPSNPAERAAKLAALEASGASGYVLVSSPTIGSFRSARTPKRKKQAPIVKEGDLIKEGQTIGFLDQFGTEVPVKSDVAGEILKFLYNDGDPVGYGDPLIAVLPKDIGK